jgi:GTP-binding protein
VGRPNVGKSSLFNCLIGRRIAIVDAVPGVTRDRISSPMALGEGYVELVDTGGFGIEDVDNLTVQVVQQIDFAIEQAQLVLLVVDARAGILPLDKSMAARLRGGNKPVILVANKVDTLSASTELGEFDALGFGAPLAMSTTHRLGRAELLERMAAELGPLTEQPATTHMKLAIVGKRNVGKSTFINTLAGSQRVIVSEIPGTTRDSVDVHVEMDGQSLMVIDTAGFRKRKSLAGDIEFYSRHRAERSIRRADVVLFFIDAHEPIGMVDKQLAAYICEEYKPAVLVVNKWDLVDEKKVDQEEYGPYLAKVMPGLAYAPIIFTSAAKGLNVRQAVRLAGELHAQAQTRVPTSRLNEAVEDILHRRSPNTKMLSKFYYATQISTAPPTIVCFVNKVEAFDQPYQRFLLGQLRQRLEFAEVPIRLIFRARGRADKPHPKRKTRHKDSENQ